MTTIAYRDGVLAADSQLTRAGVIQGHVKKILKTPQGYLVGACGTYIRCLQFLNWALLDDWDNPVQIENERDTTFSGIVVNPKGWIHDYDDTGVMYRVRAPWYSMGSGWLVAAGRMDGGGTAEEAVRSAIKWDINSGGKVCKVQLG